MAEYDKITDLPAASALDGTELVEAVQSSTSKKATVAQIKTFADGDPGIANTVTITGEHWLTEDNELNYSSSFSDGMGAATITFTELPIETVAILVFLGLADSGSECLFEWQRSSGGSQRFIARNAAAGDSNQRFFNLLWMPTHQNSIYMIGVIADAASDFYIIGYKTGA